MLTNRLPPRQAQPRAQGSPESDSFSRERAQGGLSCPFIAGHFLGATTAALPLRGISL